MNARDTRRPHHKRVYRRGRKHVSKQGGGCSMAIPAALAGAVLTLARYALVRFQFGGTR